MRSTRHRERDVAVSLIEYDAWVEWLVPHGPMVPLVPLARGTVLLLGWAFLPLLTLLLCYRTVAPVDLPVVGWFTAIQIFWLWYVQTACPRLLRRLVRVWVLLVRERLG